MNHDSQTEPRIAVLIPCYNEAPTIGKVIDDFRAQLPRAEIIVFDNCCTDETAAVAQAHGATVIKEPRQGKGYVVERIFGATDADICVMVDGDDTYSAAHVHTLLNPVIAGDADMAVGARLSEFTDTSFRPLHVAGNQLVRRLINTIFGAKLTDILSGYRAYNRRVMAQLPVVSSGFEVETELTIQLLYYRLKVIEVQVPYRERPAGSVSKLRTFRDGFRVLWKLFSLFRAVKPLTFFGALGGLLILAGLLAGIAPVHDYLTDPNRYVHHVPLAILAAALVSLGVGSIAMGVLLHAINWRFKELHNVLVRRRQRM